MKRTGVSDGVAPHRPYVPKEGAGPRGVPECYYTSRTLNSTGRHVRFVRRMRAHEEEQRLARQRAAAHRADLQRNSFLERCDRRSLMNTVADRVELCLTSYEEDLKEKRQRLRELLTAEEQASIREFVRQAQEGAAALWSDRRARLQLLLRKREAEHRDRYTHTHISKCSHVYPCLVKLRAKEAQEVQLYQMREKAMRAAAEREFDNMWHDVAMKESEALAARLQLEAVERRRRDGECERHTALQVQRQRQCRAEERELLRREALTLRDEAQLWREQQARERDNTQEKRKEMAAERRAAIEERQELLAAQRRDDELVQSAWDSLRGQSAPRDLTREQQAHQKERDLDECNRRLAELNQSTAHRHRSADTLVLEEGRRRVEAEHLQRCRAMRSRRINAEETGDAVRQQCDEQLRRDEASRQHEALTHQHERQVRAQLDQLVRHKELTEAQARHLHRADLAQQINYNQLLKERALHEELEQRKKCELARQHYQEEIREMLYRPLHCDRTHPFTGAVRGAVQASPDCVCAQTHDLSNT